MTAPARQSRHVPVNQIESTTTSTADVAPLIGRMPEHVRALALGRRKPTPDEIQRTDVSGKRADQEEFDDAQRRREAGRARLWHRRCPPKYRDASLDRLHPQQDPTGTHITSRTKVENAITSWLDGPHLQLLMRGPSRHGKSYSAYAIGNAARARGLYVSAWSMPVLNKALRGTFGEKEEQAAWDEVRDADILLVDDVGQESITEWTKEQLYVIAEHRLANEGRLVTTTNYTYSKLVELYGDPLVERLIEDAVIAVIEGQKLAQFDVDPF
ncbi:ATP-binding protein [Nonomuraea sp. NPDC023979]|uniref:ATP-binding protein n=1 Tax=Nonomuraea sp. NPDC023979 TaxID=3154796 RepID=UPI0033F0FFA5